MKTQKKAQKIKVLIPAKKPAKLANSMDCCKPNSPTPVSGSEDD